MVGGVSLGIELGRLGAYSCLVRCSSCNGVGASCNRSAWGPRTYEMCLIGEDGDDGLEEFAGRYCSRRPPYLKGGVRAPLNRTEGRD
jgi:hypothetical protein